MEGQENMENEIKEISEIKKENNLSPISIIIVVGLIVLASVYTIQFKQAEETLGRPARQDSSSLENGIILPVKWGDLGIQMTKAGVIDKTKFESIYSQRGGLSENEQKMLSNSNNGNIVISSENSGVILNMLWALGLGNKNPILENGPMMDKQYGGAGNFASTGGWTLAQGNAMNHYSMHSFIKLTPEQQALVEKVSKNIYRPCCGNSVYFPDCNHGMAMLGLLELMASQGVSEADMYKTALIVNSAWFPSTYETIKIYMKNKGVEWKDVNPKEMLGADYSSGPGFAQIASQVPPPVQGGGGSGCGVGGGAPVQQRQQSGCGVGGAPAALPAPRQQSGCGI